MSMLLRTDRLVLRRFTNADVDNLVALNADPDVMKFIDWRPPPREHVEAELAQIVRGYVAHPGCGRFAAEDAGGAFVGWFGLRASPEESHVLELGYRLRRRFWGQGLATEGSQALVRHAFVKLGARKVFAETMAVNAASRRVMEKCGMRHAGTFQAHFDDPLPGTESGEVVYELTCENWWSGGFTRLRRDA